jgi:anti-sigma regulatory factor (Ser/Thr protein kinase)
MMPGNARQQMTPHDAALNLAISSDVKEAHHARAAVERRFACLGPAMGAAKIVVSELVTNAVLHGDAPIHLTAAVHHDTVRFEVYDARPDVGPPSSESRGLMLVARLAERWGMQPAVPGKVVWAEVSRAHGS